MITFDTPLVGSEALSPYNYIEFNSAQAFTGLSFQPQRLLIIEGKETASAAPTAPATAATIAPRRADTGSLPLNKLMALAECEKEKYVLPERLNKAIKAAQLAAKASLYVLLTDKVKADDLRPLIPEEQFTHLVLCGEVQLEALALLLAERWGHDQQIDGHLFIGSKTHTTKLNSPHVTVIPVMGEDSPEEWAAAFAAVNAQYATTPSRPYQTLKVVGLKTQHPGPTLKERNELLAKGLATWRKQSDEIYIDRLVTTYLTNSQGVSDPSFRDLNVKQTLSLLRYDFRSAISLQYPRHMLAKDDFPYEGPVITPKTAKMFAIARYRKWQTMNLVQDPDGQFAKNIRVEIDDTPGKLNFYLPVYVMGQWRVTQTQIAFRL